MIDLKALRENPQKFKDGAAKKGIEVQFEQILRLDEDLREATTRRENLRAEQRRLEKESGPLIGKLKGIEDRKQLIETAAWSVLGRAPDDEEIKLHDEYLVRRDDRKQQACRQLVWALLTSSECRFNY